MSNGNPPGSTPPPPPPDDQPPRQPAQPQVQPLPQPPHPGPVQPRRKSGGGKWILIALGVLLLILIICVVIIVTVIGLGVHKVVNEIANREIVRVGIGQEGRTGDLAVRVNGWQPSGGDEFSKPGIGNQFAVVDVEIRNTGTTSKSVSTLAEMSIETPNGYQYNQAPYFPEPQFPDGDILPAQAARGNVTFEVPANIGTMDFVFKPVIIGDVVRVRLQ